MDSFNLRPETIGPAYRANAQINATSARFAASHKMLYQRITLRVKKVLSVLTAVFMPLAHEVHAGETAPTAVVEVASGVFARQGVHELMNEENGGSIANIGFVIGNTAVAIIDTGGSFNDGQALLAAVRAETDLPVRWVINTHMHPDHVFGNAAFLGPDVAYVGHANLGPSLTARFDHYVAANTLAMGSEATAGTALVLPDITVSNRHEIDLGDRVLELRAWPPAHTDNDLTVFDRKTGTLFAGDLVFLGHLPSIDGSLRGWQRAIEKLAAIPAERVVPGHGPVAAAWPDALGPQRRYFDTLAADLQAAINAGVPLSEAVKSAGGSEAEHWDLFDAFNTRNATAAFAEIEWE